MKTGFKDLPIKYKIVLVVLLLFVILFISLSLFVYFYNKKNFLSNTKNEIAIMSAVVSDNISGAVAFRDTSSIHQILQSLHRIKYLDYVGVFDNDYKLMGYYQKSDVKFDSTYFDFAKSYSLSKSAIYENKDYFIVVQPVVYRTHLLGKLLLITNKRFFYKKFINFILYELMIFLGAFSLAFISILFFQRFITKPIWKMIDSMNQVIDNNDFTIRLEHVANDEFGKMTNVFNHMIEHIELQNKILVEAQQKALHHAKIKEQFLAHMSHEIRTPLNAIYGFTILLEETKLDDNQRLYLEYVKNSIENLQVIINDILDFSKLESGKLQIKNKIFDIYKFLDDINNLFSLKAKEKKINFLVEKDSQLPRYIIGDRVRLNQILINLIGNAIKFTSVGYVKLQVSVKEKLDTKIRLIFKVIDTGIGIKKKDLDKIFEEFRQANEDISISYGGTGLGLAITKKLVEMQDGKIFVESVYKKGSIFGFEIEYKLPKDKEIKEFSLNQEEKIEYPKLEKKETKPVKVLIAEDNKINQILLQKILKKNNFEVVTVNNGKEVISALEKDNFDIILMDIHMPEMDGYEATEYIRTKMNDKKRYIPIIALTAAVTEQEVEKVGKVGMNGFVPKPFKEKDILKTIDKFVKK